MSIPAYYFAALAASFNLQLQYTIFVAVMATIPLQKALADINDNTDVPFSIVYLSYDKERPDKRGREIALDNCVKAGASHNTKQNHTIGLRPIGNTAHIHTAHIHSIVMYNGQMVIL